jgi:hypothetical protein
MIIITTLRLIRDVWREARILQREMERRYPSLRQ